MHCTICNATIPESGSSSLRAVCEKCSVIDHSKIGVQEANAASDSIPQVAFATAGNKRHSERTSKPPIAQKRPKPEQTIESARAVARAWRESAAALHEGHTTGRLIRFDREHNSDKSEVEENSSVPNPIASPTSIASARHAVSFGLFVFLMGQALMMGAFIVGHFAAWSVGILFSIGGITVSILSVHEALRRLDQRFTDNARRASRPLVNSNRRRQRKHQV